MTPPGTSHPTTSPHTLPCHLSRPLTQFSGHATTGVLTRMATPGNESNSNAHMQLSRPCVDQSSPQPECRVTYAEGLSRLPHISLGPDNWHIHVPQRLQFLELAQPIR